MASNELTIKFDTFTKTDKQGRVIEYTLKNSNSTRIFERVHYYYSNKKSTYPIAAKLVYWKGKKVRP